MNYNFILQSPRGERNFVHVMYTLTFFDKFTPMLWWETEQQKADVVFRLDSLCIDKAFAAQCYMFLVCLIYTIENLNTPILLIFSNLKRFYNVNLYIFPVNLRSFVVCFDGGLTF